MNENNELIQKNEDWLTKAKYENYAKGLFYVGALMKLAEKTTNKIIKWEPDKDPVKKGLNTQDILDCYSQALENIRNSHNKEAWEEAEQKIKKISIYLPNLPNDKNLEKPGPNNTFKMLSARLFVDAGHTVAYLI